MTPYYTDDWLTVWQGDCREVMAQMPAESVHMVCTSPPYWGLRDYGTATWLGGDDGCDHKPKGPSRTTRPAGGLEGGKATVDAGTIQRDCHCGAVRQDSQLGLEPTPEEYVANMVAVFREVRRVLRSDGTVWLNLGDSYATGTSKPSKPDANNDVGYWNNADGLGRSRIDGRSSGLKPKDLIGIPWRVAFALQQPWLTCEGCGRESHGWWSICPECGTRDRAHVSEPGWYLRSDIIWAKPNPMPESVTDRPTKAHEYLFLLSKSPRYYYDADAVREPLLPDTLRPSKHGPRGAIKGMAAGQRHVHPGQPSAMQNMGDTLNPAGRNLRSVWSIATQPYPGAHFATFPEKLVEPCVKAGTSERGVCPECGAPWRRETSIAYVKSPVHGAGSVIGRHEETGANGWDGSGMPRLNKEVTTTGWQPSCVCLDPETDFKVRPLPVPATVLDPFAGSGTTGRVAQRLGRRAVLIDLSGDYLVQAMKRNTEIPLGLESA